MKLGKVGRKQVRLREPFKQERYRRRTVIRHRQEVDPTHFARDGQWPPANRRAPHWKTVPQVSHQTPVGRVPIRILLHHLTKGRQRLPSHLRRHFVAVGCQSVDRPKRFPVKAHIARHLQERGCSPLPRGEPSVQFEPIRTLPRSIQPDIRHHIRRLHLPRAFRTRPSRHPNPRVPHAKPQDGLLLRPNRRNQPLRRRRRCRSHFTTTRPGHHQRPQDGNTRQHG